MSLANCAAADVKRYTELAVFPEDTWIPLRVLEVYHGSGATEVQEFVQRLGSGMLLQLQVSLNSPPQPGHPL